MATWSTSPGATIADMLEERGWTVADLSKSSGIPLRHLDELVNGSESIDADTAGRLALVLGSTPEFWLRREAAYRAAARRTDRCHR